jgi:hypothetical protein
MWHFATNLKGNNYFPVNFFNASHLGSMASFGWSADFSTDNLLSMASVSLLHPGLPFGKSA